MASSNIKLFDENKGNMISDSEFSISNQRLNGLQTGVASSQLQNKAMYQVSLVAYAIAQIMMQNGKNANDTDAVSTFVANLSGTMLQKVYDLATTAEAKAGVATGKWMSPALVKAAIDSLAAKAQNILSDTTKVLYGLDSSAVPDDVFAQLAIGNGKYGYLIYVKFPDGTPVSGISVSGLSDVNGKALVTNTDGWALGVSTEQSVTVSVTSPWDDVSSVQDTVIQSTKTITEATLTLFYVSELTVSESKNVILSSKVNTLDICCVGGGGGGGGHYENKGSIDYTVVGGGGGGGYVSNALGVARISNTKLSVTIGSGGWYGDAQSGRSGSAGGTTTVALEDGTSICSAKGGEGGKAPSSNASNVSQASGGVGNGNGGKAGRYSVSSENNGSDGSGYKFNDESLGLAGGGGGGGGVVGYDEHTPEIPGGLGGSPFGGNGSYAPYNSYGGSQAEVGSIPGGGGGGGACSIPGSIGGHGIAYFRFNH